MLEQVSKQAFFVFLVLLPIQTVWLWREPMIDGAKWQYGTIGLYATDAVLIAALLSYGICIVTRKYPRFGNTLGMTTALLTALVVWSGLSFLWAEDGVLAGYFFLKLLLALGAGYLVRSIGVSQMRKVFGGVLLLVGAESIVGIGQFLSQSSFASTLLGMSGYESWQAGVSVLKNESGRWLRAYGTFPHPNMYGAYLGAVLVSLIGYIVWAAKRPVASIAVSMVLLLGLLVSFSRSAWLGAILGLAALVAIVVAKGNGEQRYRLAKTLSVIGIAAGVFAGVLHETVSPRFDGATVQKEASIVDRAALVRQSWHSIREHPLLGVGAGNYTLAVMQQYPTVPVWEAQPVHNVFLLVCAELGMIGFILFVLFLLSVFYAGLKNLFSKDVQENAIFFIAFLSLVPSLFLDHFLWDSHFGLFFLFVFAGLSLKGDEC